MYIQVIYMKPRSMTPRRENGEKPAVSRVPGALGHPEGREAAGLYDVAFYPRQERESRASVSRYGRLKVYEVHCLRGGNNGLTGDCFRAWRGAA